MVTETDAKIDTAYGHESRSTGARRVTGRAVQNEYAVHRYIAVKYRYATTGGDGSSINTRCARPSAGSAAPACPPPRRWAFTGGPPHRSTGPPAAGARRSALRAHLVPDAQHRGTTAVRPPFAHPHPSFPNRQRKSRGGESGSKTYSGSGLIRALIKPI